MDIAGPLDFQHPPLPERTALAIRANLHMYPSMTDTLCVKVGNVSSDGSHDEWKNTWHMQCIHQFRSLSCLVIALGQNPADAFLSQYPRCAVQYIETIPQKFTTVSITRSPSSCRKQRHFPPIVFHGHCLQIHQSGHLWVTYAKRNFCCNASIHASSFKLLIACKYGIWPLDS